MKTKTTNNPLIMDVFERIAQERCRQNAEFAEGRSQYTCASPATLANYNAKEALLVIAMGDVRECVTDLDVCNNRATIRLLQGDLVKLAAHCVAWLEALEHKLPPSTEKQIDTVLHGRSA